MLINLTKVVSSGDYNKSLKTTINMDNIFVDGQSYNISKQPVVELNIEGIGTKEIEVNGSFETVINIPCNRCMDTVGYTIKENINKHINLDETKEDREKNLDEMTFVDGFNLDIEELIHNEIIVHFPMRVLCNENCKGICKQCGENLNLSQCKCDNKDIDVRMSVFQDILKQL